MRTLIVGDIHEPVSHPGYLRFCQDIGSAWGCTDVVLIGDVVDWHSISFHPKHPEAPGAMDEYNDAKAAVARWRKAFPKAKVCIGNHDERVFRLAESVNIPSFLIRKYNDVWDTPDWQWAYEHILEGEVYCFHGTGMGGVHPAYNAMNKMCMSVIMGHLHTAGGTKWQANPMHRFFGMDVGCGIDDRAAAMMYGQHMKRKSVLSCGVLIDGVPYHEPMPCGRGEKYHRSRFTK